MFFSMARLSLTAAGLLLPIYVQAVAFSVNSFEGISVGKPVNLTWWGDKNPVTIKLMKGKPEALEPVVTVATNVPGELYTWTPMTIPSGTYVLSITQGDEVNYSPQFPVANTPPPSSKGTAEAAPLGDTGPVLPSAIIAANDYTPDVYFNGSGYICNEDDLDPCVSNITASSGHYRNSAAGVGRVGGAVGAAVVGIAFAVFLVL